MIVSLGLLLSLAYTVAVCVHHCGTGLGPPTKLKYRWLDAFTVKVSWEIPSNLPKHCDVEYLVKWSTKHSDQFDKACIVNNTNYSQSFFTEGMDSEHWTFYISTVVGDCNSVKNGSNPATIDVYPKKTQGELVKDFKCFIQSNTLNCSWIPNNKSLNLTVSYRNCGFLEESINTLKNCNQLYSSAERNGCNMHVGKEHENTCVLVETAAEMSTFKPKLVLPPPKLTIKEESDWLVLSITSPMNDSTDCWSFHVCHSECNKSKNCSNTMEKEQRFSYNRRCLYEFRSKMVAKPTCYTPLVESDFSEPQTHGVDKPPDRTLTMVAIAIPLILSICVILSCYCFRRHSNVFFPVIPDPSVIFKEMMMNGNKEHKTMTGNLYTPVPECVEPCKIIPLP